MPKIIQYHGAMTGFGSISFGSGAENMLVMLSKGVTNRLFFAAVGGFSPSAGSAYSTAKRPSPTAFFSAAVTFSVRSERTQPSIYTASPVSTSGASSLSRSARS